MSNEDTILTEVSADERMRSILTSKEKYERDTLARINFARKEGYEIGFQIGWKEGFEKVILDEGAKKAIALLLDMGLDKDTILSKVATAFSLDTNTLNEWYDEIDK